MHKLQSPENCEHASGVDDALLDDVGAELEAVEPFTFPFSSGRKKATTQTTRMIMPATEISAMTAAVKVEEASVAPEAVRI